MPSFPPPAGEHRPAPGRERTDARALAAARRERMQIRARRIRRTVIGTSLALFLAAFLAVYVQLASGHDPALVGAAHRKAAASAAGSSSGESSAASTETGGSTGTGSSAGVEEAGAESGASEEPAPLTTRQS